MNLRRLLTLGALALLAGCATADRVKALEEKVASLEEKIEEVAKSGGKAAPRDEKAEKAAAALYEEIGKAIRGGDTDGAKQKLGEMKKKYSIEFIEKQTSAWKNKIISENVVQSTLHFAKRTDKLMSYLSKIPIFEHEGVKYSVSSFL